MIAVAAAVLRGPRLLAPARESAHRQPSMRSPMRRTSVDCGAAVHQPQRRSCAGLLHRWHHRGPDHGPGAAARADGDRAQLELRLQGKAVRPSRSPRSRGPLSARGQCPAPGWPLRINDSRSTPSADSTLGRPLQRHDGRRLRPAGQAIGEIVAALQLELPAPPIAARPPIRRPTRPAAGLAVCARATRRTERGNQGV